MTEKIVALPYHQRTHDCGSLRAADVGKTVLLAGWVSNSRDLGGMVFIDLRDRGGITQLRFNPETAPEAHQIAQGLRGEDVIVVRGQVEHRGDKVNPNVPTGEIEIAAREVEVLSKSKTPPFEIIDTIDTNEDLRLQYRVLDIRRTPVKNALILRHRITKTIRDYFDRQGFIDVETPILTKSTPEGARDYLVPSRLHHGRFYALPQSPQLFKQLLMIGGMDRYMQIARCFRDEDLRADRQPEFTQVDVEMAFVQPENIMHHAEACLAEASKAAIGVDIPLPLPRISYADAMKTYGRDAPDMRYDMTIKDVSAPAGKTSFKVFREALDAGGVVRCIVVPKGAEMTRKETDALAEEMKGVGAGGLPLVKVAQEAGKTVLQTGVAKFFDNEALVGELLALSGAKPGDLICFAAESEANVSKHLGWLRSTIAERRKLIPKDKWAYCWVVDFPSFGHDPEEGTFPMHHPFTSPKDEDLHLLRLGANEVPPIEDILKIRAKAYDVVLNGVELGGGSIRIHRSDVQAKVFQILGMTAEEARIKFEFLLEALQFGAPPHGGIALGLDRIVMMLGGYSSIRDVIAFPKNARAICPMTDAPGEVAEKQLKELGLKITGD
ncbi:MAG TPA: aspartate--tRNA ligase [Phycisphaerae bacterium]|nr:aspartate--tRNA ligase [Phycisphaerae bacterium]